MKTRVSYNYESNLSKLENETTIKCRICGKLGHSTRFCRNKCNPKKRYSQVINKNKLGFFVTKYTVENDLF